jgi:hypothetical protein
MSRASRALQRRAHVTWSRSPVDVSGAASAEEAVNAEENEDRADDG